MSMYVKRAHIPFCRNSYLFVEVYSSAGLWACGDHTTWKGITQLSPGEAACRTNTYTIWSVFAYACAYEYINKSAPAVFKVRNKMLIDCYNNNKPLVSIDSDELAYVKHYTRPHISYIAYREKCYTKRNKGKQNTWHTRVSRGLARELYIYNIGLAVGI